MHFLLLFAKKKKKQPDKQGRNVQMLPTSAPWPVLNCEGSGKKKTCGEFKKEKKENRIRTVVRVQSNHLSVCWSYRTLAKCGQGNIFHSISSFFK